MTLPEQFQVTLGSLSVPQNTRVSIRSPLAEKVALAASAAFVLKALYPLSVFATSLTFCSIVATAPMVPLSVWLFFGLLYCAFDHNPRSSSFAHASLDFLNVSVQSFKGTIERDNREGQ